MLLAELLHLAEQHFFLRSVEGIVPAFFRTVRFAEIQLQRIADCVLFYIIVGVYIESVIVLIGADEGAKGSVHIEICLQIKVKLAV